MPFPLLLLASLAAHSAAKPMTSNAAPQTPYVSFEGEKTTWHDFDRYDYVMDDALTITPFKRPAGEGDGIAPPAQGQRRCIVVCPKKPAPGNPWSWQACYWDHQPQTEVELLKRGYHIVYISADSDLKPDQHWEAWYDYLTQKHGLAKKSAFVGMSRGGQYELQWATRHPDRISAIYGDNPAGDDEIFKGLLGLARQDVPLLFVVGTNDPLLPQFGLPMESMYQHFGGRISMMIKEGAGHHPHSLHDPKPIADFLERSFQESPPSAPDFIGTNRFERTNYYGDESHYAWYPQDGYFISTRGPAFVDGYNRYKIWLGFDNPVTVIAPKKEAPGRPWVLRSNFVERNAAIDQALLAKGFHIVTGSVGYNADGPKLADWNGLYTYLTGHGFASKPVLEGEGGASGSVYAWAVENPEKVACIVARNPILSAPGFEKQPLDHLDVLAKAGVNLLHLCDNPDPDLEKESRKVEDKYRAAKGAISTIHPGHAATPQDIVLVVNFILRHL